MEKENYQHLRFALYARRSQDREDRQVSSIESQTTEVKEFAKRMGFNVVKFYEDSASAHKPNNRPSFKRMLQDIEKGEIDVILVWKADRLARNMIEGGILIHMLQTNQFSGIQTPFSRYLPTDNMLPLIIEMGMANQYSLDLSKSIKRGNKTRVKKGGFCSRAPLGYKNCKETKDILKDPETFDKVKILFTKFATGMYSISQLIEISDKEIGLVGMYNKKPLSKSAIHRMLHNPFYYGKVICGELESMGKHKPMISFALFQKVQQVLKQDGRSAQTNNEFAYTGFMSCGECGCAITGEQKVKYKCPKCNSKQTAKHPRKCSCGYQITSKDISKGKNYTYYRCTKSKQKCTQKFLNGDLLDVQFQNFIGDLSLEGNFLDWSKSWLESIEKDINQENYSKRLIDQKRIAQIQFETESLLDLRIRKEIDQETFTSKKEKLEGELTLLQSRQNQSADTKQKIIQEIDTLIGLEEKFQNSDKKQKKQLLLKIASNPVLMDKKLLVQAKKVYLILKSLRKHKNLNIEPSKSHSDSSLKGLEKECRSVWCTLLNEFEIIYNEIEN